VTGYIVSTVEEAVIAVGKIDKLSRKKIREVFESRFTSEIMVKNYLDIYERVIKINSKKKYSNLRSNPNENFSRKVMLKPV
jgi:hypothetical protein